MLPSKVQHLAHHKMSCNGISFLRMAAVYGANGAGKTNMIKALVLLKQMIADGKVVSNVDRMKFKLDEGNAAEPSSMAIEFLVNDHFYYYAVSFDDKGVAYESLFESKRDNDVIVFEREFSEGEEHISFEEGYTNDPKNKLFVDVLCEKLIGRDVLLLAFLNNNYEKEFPVIHSAYQWFVDTLVVISAGENRRPIAQMLDENKELLDFSNSFIIRLDTGISQISIEKKELDDEDNEFHKIIASASDGSKGLVVENRMTGNLVTIIREGDKIYEKRVITKHSDSSRNNAVKFDLGMESDGTKRLLDYLPFIYDIISKNHVYVVDEIERSIHPVIIKSIISFLSAIENMTGQLVFSTHESCLLDQDIIRTDEIWFVQKDVTGSTRIYPLSDFKVHHTANIENGYLNGRYGAIPFVSNLNDLHWNHE